MTKPAVALAALCSAFIAFAGPVPSPRFVLSVLVSSDGTEWAGTEGEGLFFREPGQDEWTLDSSFKSVGGTNVFALCEDSCSRIWAGTLDHGACIRDGSGWKRLSVEEGLAGTHVYSLGSDLRDNVWIATDGGLCRYSDSERLLTVYDRTSELDFGEVTSIAVSKKGEVVIGTACNGAFSSNRQKLWKSWEKMKTRSSRINGVAFDGQGTSVLVSNEGVEIGRGSKMSWSVVSERRPGTPKPLACTFLDGLAIVGFEEHGVKSVNVEERKLSSALQGTGKCRVTALSSGNGVVLAGTYGDGVVVIGERKQGRGVARKSAIAEFKNPKRTVAAVADGKGKLEDVKCYYMRDDWETKGNWCGRYGLRTAVLCAQNAQNGDETVCSDPRYSVGGRIGENRKKGDMLRRWLHWKSTKNINTLHNPHLGHRRQSEWDDHSEAYPQSNQGPNLLVEVSVPDGWQEVALYFFNKDGETGENFRRDYVVSAFSGRDDSGVPLAISRVRHFRNGVYKRFAVLGPETYTFRIERDNSFSTILSAVLVQRMCEGKEVQSDPRLSTCLHYGGLVYREPCPDGGFQPKFDSCANGASYDREMSRAMAEYRRLLEGGEPAEIRRLRWLLRVWTDDERVKFGEAMLAAWTCLQMKSPRYRSAKFFPDSPNVLNRDVRPSDYSPESPLLWLEDAALLNPEPVRKSEGNFYYRVVNLHGRGDFIRD